MDVRPSFEDTEIKGKVYRLQKSVYGLKQSPRAWFDHFLHAMLRYRFKQSQGGHTFFTKHSSSGKVMILIVYVDDIVLTGDDLEEIGKLKCNMAKEFEIKDLGNLKYFLAIEVVRSNDGIFISQRQYVLDLLKEIGMLGSKAVDTIMDPNLKLSDDRGGELVEKGREWWVN